MNVLFFGSKERGVESLRAIQESDHTIVGVVTRGTSDPDAFWEGTVREAAESIDVPLHTPADVNAESVRSELETLAPDVFVLSGYSQILGPALLNIPSEGSVNLHAGKLPDYRGGSPMNWAIINGETSITLSIHWAVESLDAGDVLAEEEITIGAEDTIAEVRRESIERYPEMLVSVLDNIQANEVTARTQCPEEGKYYGSRRPHDGRIRWDHMTAKKVYDFVRALTRPYPGAFTFLNGEKLYVWEASLPEDDIEHHPGRVCFSRGQAAVVATADGAVMLKTVQLEGEEAIPAVELLEQGMYLGAMGSRGLQGGRGDR